MSNFNIRFFAALGCFFTSMTAITLCHFLISVRLSYNSVITIVCPLVTIVIAACLSFETLVSSTTFKKKGVEMISVFLV